MLSAALFDGALGLAALVDGNLLSILSKTSAQPGRLPDAEEHARIR